MAVRLATVRPLRVGFARFGVHHRPHAVDRRPGYDRFQANKGLKPDALGYISNLVIAIASTAPAYSLAATLGFIVAVAGRGLSTRPRC